MILFLLGCGLTPPTSHQSPIYEVKTAECREAIAAGWSGDPRHCDEARKYSNLFPCMIGDLRSTLCQPTEVEGLYATYDWTQFTDTHFVQTGTVDGAPQVFRPRNEDAVVNRD